MTNDLLPEEYITQALRDARRFSGTYDQGTSGTLAAHTHRLINERRAILTTISELERQNAELRAQVEKRLASTPPDVPAAFAATLENVTLVPAAPVPAAEFKPTCVSSSMPLEQAAAAWDAVRAKAGAVRDKAEPISTRRVDAPAEATPPSENYADWEPAFQAKDLRPGSGEFLAVLDELKTLHLRKTLDYGIDEDALSNIRSSADVVNMPAWAGCILRISDKMHRLKSFFRRGKVEFDGVPDTLLDICAYSAIALVLYRESLKK